MLIFLVTQFVTVLVEGPNIAPTEVIITFFALSICVEVAL